MSHTTVIDVRRIALLLIAIVGVSLAVGSYVGIDALVGGEEARTSAGPARVVAIVTGDADLVTSPADLRSAGFEVRTDTVTLTDLHRGVIDVLMLDRAATTTDAARSQIVRLYNEGVAVAGLNMSMVDLLEFLPDSPEPPDERGEGQSVNDAWTNLPPDVRVFAITKTVGDCTGATFIRLPSPDGLRALADRYAQLCEQ